MDAKFTKRFENYKRSLASLAEARQRDLTDSFVLSGTSAKFCITFDLAWKCARPNAIVTVVALYDRAQSLPLPDMYGKNLTFKTGGVDGCDCEETLRLIAEGKIDTEPLITHTYPLSRIEEAYDLFENKKDGVIKVAVECG